MKHLKYPPVQSPRPLHESRSRSIEERVVNHAHSPFSHCRKIGPTWTCCEKLFPCERSRAADTENNELWIKRLYFLQAHLSAWEVLSILRANIKRNPSSNLHNLWDPIPGNHRRVVPFLDVDARISRESTRALLHLVHSLTHPLRESSGLRFTGKKHTNLNNGLMDICK